VGLLVYWFEGRTVAETPSDVNNVTSTLPENPATSKYADGNYNLTTDYMSPGGKDSLGVAVTLANGVITDVSVQNMANDRTSKGYQDRFIGGIKSAVVGKSIDNLKLGVVSGASLATNAFNKALTEIRSQAQAVK
jgi:uncharacterized protein with FMN-binding domain